MLKSYVIQTNCCDLFFEDGTSKRIYYYADSGKLLKLKRTHPLNKTEVEHKGVIIGKLYDETIMVLHNQLTLDQAEVITYKNLVQENEEENILTETHFDIYNFLHQALRDAVSLQPYAALERASVKKVPGHPTKNKFS